MKRFYRISFLLGLLFLLFIAGCQKDKSIAPPAYEYSFQQFDGVAIDNAASLSQLLTASYHLSELSSWFPELSRQEAQAFLGDALYGARPKFSEVNGRFPIQCLRCNFNTYYTVYRVQEGGYYYVFWDGIPYPTAKEDYTPPTNVEGAEVGFSVYINSRPAKSDFSSIIPGRSTAADVACIDPSLELKFWASSGYYSYSLLNDGRIFEVLYERPQPMTFYKNRSEMIVKDLSVYTLVGEGSYLGAIRLEDLP